MSSIIYPERILYIILFFHFILWNIFSFHLDLHPDMSDHWVWSRHLDWGYYEHPPMVAWNMRIATELGNLLGVANITMLKLGSVIFSTVILYLSYMMGKVYFQPRIALIFVILLESTIYFSIGSVFWHIDQFYLVAWLGCMIVMGKYFNDSNHKWFLVIGVITGLGAISKYIMILFYLSLFAWIIFDRTNRNLIKNYYIYLSGIISFIIFSPVFYWNYIHDWISFKFQLYKGLKDSSGIETFLLFSVGHIILFSIILTVLSWILLFRSRLMNLKNNSVDKFLLSTVLTPFFFFTLSSLRGNVADPHWLNITYFSLFLLLARYIDQFMIKQKPSYFYALISTAYGLNYILIGFAMMQTFTNIAEQPVEFDSTTKLLGWKKTAQQIESSLEAIDQVKPKFVISREYQLASALSLYLDDHPWPHSIEKSERNVWSPVDQIQKHGAVMVCVVSECEKVYDQTFERFQTEILPVNEIKTAYGERLLRNLFIYLVLPQNSMSKGKS